MSSRSLSPTSRRRLAAATPLTITAGSGCRKMEPSSRRPCTVADPFTHSHTAMNGTSSPSALLAKIRLLLAIVIVGLVLSGLTAFPLVRELDLLASFLPGGPSAAHPDGGLAWWILRVREGLHHADLNYPFLAYGTDWLAFSHAVIAAFFIPPFLNPVRHAANLYIGLAACAGVLLIALVCGPIRGIPVYWRLIDCSFGII